MYPRRELFYCDDDDEPTCPVHGGGFALSAAAHEALPLIHGTPAQLHKIASAILRDVPMPETTQTPADPTPE